METEGWYTIAELADASTATLNALGIAARNGQVRGRPDARTIRYYSALGLVDRPAEMTGRTARYGERHLLQVVAVKALQARGESLADVQRRLVGASEAELRAVIGPGLPRGLTPAARPARAFWRTPPVPAPVSPAAPRTSAPEAAVAAPGPARTDGAADGAMAPRALVAVPLAAGATLLIEGAGPEDVDAAALRAAAAPLLAQLSQAGLLPGSASPLTTRELHRDDD